jgi:hypothetical protein
VNLDELIRVVDRLEDEARNYLTLDEIESKIGAQVVPLAIAEGVLLIDHRMRADGTPVTLARLNRHHPVVQRLTSW